MTPSGGGSLLSFFSQLISHLLRIWLPFWMPLFWSLGHATHLNFCWGPFINAHNDGCTFWFPSHSMGGGRLINGEAPEAPRHSTFSATWSNSKCKEGKELKGKVGPPTCKWTHATSWIRTRFKNYPLRRINHRTKEWIGFFWVGHVPGSQDAKNINGDHLPWWTVSAWTKTCMWWWWPVTTQGKFTPCSCPEAL